MSNRLEELHYQYKRYYLKKILKFVGVVVALSTVFIIAYLLIQEAPIEQKVIREVKQVQHVKELPPLQKEKPLIKDNRKAYTLDVSDDELEASVKKIEAKKHAKVHTPTKIKTKPKPKSVQNVQIPVQEEVQTTLFNNAQEEKSLEEWIEKYNKKKSYGAAIYISKQYYLKKDYKHSGIWAKRANQLNRNKEEAWLYYAKSMHALGDVAKARRILNIYLQYKKSVKAELLLSEWGQ